MLLRKRAKKHSLPSDARGSTATLELKEMKYTDDYSGYGNKVLYRMCKEAPTHNDIDEIMGKIWIIGRSYSASIERKAGPKMINGKDFYKDQVAPAIKNSDIGKWIDSVSSIRRLTKENVHLALAAHKNVTDLFKEITGVDKRSLASKYLHFHKPKAFFIYDSLANVEIRKILRDKKQRHQYIKGYDDEYSSFVARCLYYRDNYFEKHIGGLSTPRKLDMKLLGY